MFKKVNLQSEICEDKYILMKNIREEFCEIPKEYVANIHYSWHEINSMDIEVPYLISIDGVKKINPLYDKFLGKRQCIKVNEEEKYVITDCEKTENYKGQKVKKITAQSAEITLNDFDYYIGEGGITRKLFKAENDVDISDGLLDLCLAETGWKVSRVSDKARLEFNKINEIYYKDLYNSLQKNNVAKDMVLWEKTFTDLNPLINNVLTLNINYKNIKSYIAGKLQKEENIIHQLGNFHTGISKIKATYSGNDEYRYAVKYDITLTDGLTTERWFEFTYLGAMDVTFETINMSYTTGLEVEKSYLKYRSFDEGIYSIYDFLKQEVESAFGVKFIFDTMNKTISCYEFSEVGEETHLFLSFRNFIQTINKKEQYDEIITKLYVESQKATISEENPTGLDYILDFTYFRENGIMSDELILAYDRYIASINGKQELIVTKRIDLNTWNKKKIKLDTEKQTIEENIKGLQSIWNSYIKEKDDVNASRIASEINELQNQVAIILRETEICRQAINSLNDEIKILVNSITMATATDVQGKIFGDELLEEINSITITDTLSDDYYTTSYSLYNYAVDFLAKKNKLQIEFDVDTVGLLQNLIIPDGYKFDDILVLGDYINIEDEDIDNGKVRLIAFDYSPKDFKIDGLKFSNNDEDFIITNKLGNIGRSINKSLTYTNNYKTSWVAGKNVNNFVNSMLTDYLDAKAVNIRSRQGRNKYDQSEVGTYIIDALSDGEMSQIYLGSGMICFTGDGWLTCKTCLDGNGLVGEAIVGKLLIGNNLLIGNENNTMIIDENGITIDSNHLYIKGTDGTNTNFESYLEIINESIRLGITSANEYTNAQIKITDEKIESKVAKGEVISSINQTAETIKIKANKIQLEGTTTIAGDSGDRVRINNANYEILNGSISKAFFGLKEIDDNRLVPRVALSHSGLNQYTNNYFVMTAHDRGNNPLGTSSSYVDLAYRCQEYKLPDGTGDVSNVRMISDGDIQLSSIREVIMRSNYKNGVYSGDGSEYDIGKFSSSGSAYFDGNLQIDCVRNVEDRENGLVLADYGKGSDNATVIRVATDSTGTKFVRPVDTKKDIRLGSPTNAWYNVYTSVGSYSSNGVYSSDTAIFSVDMASKSSDEILDEINFFEARTFTIGDTIEDDSLKMDVTGIMDTCYVERSEDSEETYINLHEMVKLLIYEVKKLKEENRQLKEIITN